VETFCASRDTRTPNCVAGRSHASTAAVATRRPTHGLPAPLLVALPALPPFSSPCGRPAAPRVPPRATGSGTCAAGTRRPPATGEWVASLPPPPPPREGGGGQWGCTRRLPAVVRQRPPRSLQRGALQSIHLVHVARRRSYQQEGCAAMVGDTPHVGARRQQCDLHARHSAESAPPPPPSVPLPPPAAAALRGFHAPLPSLLAGAPPAFGRLRCLSFVLAQRCLTTHSRVYSRARPPTSGVAAARPPPRACIACGREPPVVSPVPTPIPPLR
jgi:hypothetical protein